MEAIISAAETGFTGSLVGSMWMCRLTRLAAYIGTMTGCFFCPELTMFLVSMPRQQSRALLQWEPPHWYLRPNVHTHLLHGDLFPSSPPGGSSRIFRDTTWSPQGGRRSEGSCCETPSPDGRTATPAESTAPLTHTEAFQRSSSNLKKPLVQETLR
uniref:Uncharacterized protein n=1 Tax=Seriola lalandi dorsalis TaxID=1841481 RepID=A0A3B4XVK1_SERLL